MRWLDTLFRRRRSEDRLDAELRFHLEEQIDEYIAAGMSLKEARRRARLEFGGMDPAKEACRDARPFHWLENLLADARFALRGFARTPGFTAVCLLTLALGIGVNSAIFTVVNELVLKPPPFKEPDRLVVIRQQVDSFEALTAHGRFLSVNFFQHRQRLHTVEEVTVYNNIQCELQGLPDPRNVSAISTPDNFARVLGVSLAYGRWFTQEEWEKNEAVAVISHELWREQFSGAPDILGNQVSLVKQGSSRLYTIIGVAPREIENEPLAHRWDVFIPLDISQHRDPAWLPANTLARLKHGIHVDQAHAEMITLQRSIHADQGDSNNWPRIVVRRIVEDSIIEVRTGLLVLVAAVGCVLLVACANLANLLLCRGIGRHREMAVRACLGASRNRLFRQVLTESALLSLTGGGLGLLVAWTGVRGLLSIRFSGLPVVDDIHIDGMVVAFTFILSLVTALLFGLLPAMKAVAVSFQETLRSGGATVSAGLSERRLRTFFVIVEIAVSFILVAGAGLLVNTMLRLTAIDPGFDPRNLLVTSIRPHWDIVRDQVKITAFHEKVLEHVNGLPGVLHAAITTEASPLDTYFVQYFRLPDDNGKARWRNAPGLLSGASSLVFIGGKNFPTGVPLANSRSVSSDYFSTMKIPLLVGRTFDQSDNAQAGRVAVINQAFVELYWPGENAVGRQVMLLPGEVPTEIVGVVADTHWKTEESAPLFYFHYLQSQRISDLLIRTAGDPLAMVGAVTSAVREVDPTLPFRYWQTMEGRIEDETAEQRFYMYLLSALALLALLLAAVGLYGVVAHYAGRRTHEIGLRMALGSDRGDIQRMIASQGLRLAVIGVVLGLAGSLALTRYLKSWLYGITPTDPLTLASVAVLLIVIAFAASYLPSRRASRLDPVDALRCE